MKTTELYGCLALFVGIGVGGCQGPPATDSGTSPSVSVSLDAQATLGREVFLQHSRPACSQCHTLKDAGAQSRIGANLDDLKPTFEQVKQSVTQGIGIMPPQTGQLSIEQIDAVAHYVVTVAGK